MMMKNYEDEKRARALHCVKASDMCSKLIRLRIRMQKLLMRMNQWPTKSTLKDENHDAVRQSLSESLALMCNDVASTAGKVDLEKVETSLAAKHSARMAKCREILAEQHKRTATLAGKDGFQKFAQSPVELIDRTLQDRERLLRRTQISRSGFRPPDAVLVDPVAAPAADLNSDEAIIQAAEEERRRKKEGDKTACPDVFDDSDFYEQLLQEFIRNQSASVESMDGKKWADLHQLRSKMKVEASDRASKGRKVRYTISPKMVNISTENYGIVSSCSSNKLLSDAVRESIWQAAFQ